MIHRPPPPRAPAPAAPVARRALAGLLTRHARAALVVEEAGRARAFGAADATTPVVRVLDPRAWVAVASTGSAGLGEGYFRGWWESRDLVGLVRALIRNTAGLDACRNRWSARTGPVTDRLRRLRRSDARRDRANVRAHYDLSNDFFALLLDPTMTYSCAVFADPAVGDEPLEVAQRRKLDGWCRSLDLRPGTRLVEIGSGWGGLARHAASEFGAAVTTTTVSAQQATYVRDLVAANGLGGRVTPLDVDYRALRGTYDRLCSVEMIEAVDWRDHGEYFATCSRLLAPDGLAGIQAIVVPDARFERVKRSSDFIKRWVFPGGCLPSLGSISASVRSATDLRPVGVRDLGPHYAVTLRRWRERLAAHADRLPALGFDDQLRRLFEFYLAYCEAAFLERHVSVVQLALAKPGWHGTLGETPGVASLRWTPPTAA